MTNLIYQIDNNEIINEEKSISSHWNDHITDDIIRADSIDTM